MKLRWRTVGRDVALVLLLTFLGGFVIGLGGAQGGRAQLAIAASNLVFGIVAFTVVGCLSPQARLAQLLAVVCISWLLSFFNVVFLGRSLVAWAASLVFLAFVAGIGGLLSHLFARTPRDTDTETAV